MSRAALAVLGVLRKEWEMASSDLRAESGVTNRKAFTLALDELQAAMIVVPSDVVYEPKFTYLWGLAEERSLEWPGNSRKAVDNTNLGKYLFEVRDVT